MQKCKCVHYGHTVMTPIETSHTEIHLGVITAYIFEVKEQSGAEASNKANALLDTINKAFKYQTEEVVAGLLHLGMAPFQA